MNISLDLVDYLYSVVIFFTTFIFAIIIGRKFKLSLNMIVVLFLWHSLFSIIYYTISLLPNSTYDSVDYYLASSQEDLGGVSVGTQFIRYFTSFFTKGFGFSYLGNFLLYNMIGVVGFFAFVASLKKTNVYKVSNCKKYFFYMLIFLPSLSFWSSAIGKDVFSFMAIGLSIYSMIDKPKYFLFSISVLFMFLVRPHVAMIMLVAMMLSVMVYSKTKFYIKFSFVAIGLVVAFVAIPFAIQYVGIQGDISYSRVIEYIQYRQTLNQQGGSSLNISSISLPMQLITYVLRPFPFEAHNSFALFTSLENVFLLLIFIKGIALFLKKSKSTIRYNYVYMLSFSIVSWVLLATTTANLGLASRQKWMFVPVICFLIFAKWQKRDSKHDNE
ncbi:hypothetical protein [Phocoenobacter skyensis]|uniref:EpsG family protein n=1 Tax=Phocoenobacter skyensis TaxID=97481 RepID=A0A1H7WGV9_9PAST|nr:hypothetical protein [Pasteurella skyensis]MDP8079227.1 hypothetical protein [Pasteurella skyensis]MDP8085163.1 hypothetical protein [Pasteurella skyensis]MDP8185080.1 hypothetical protein [Pasteurella skyensis]QLB22234.1 hypothetical protein A6B44_03075 [Pasteurella skyensis]SEM20731.1 hypothetical protein SAMN05444853_10847 [Pasteurella skyensis]